MVRLDVGVLSAEESCLSAHCSQHGKDQFLRCSVGMEGSQIWSGLSCLFFSLLNVTLCKQRVIEERLLEHISKIIENRVYLDFSDRIHRP